MTSPDRVLSALFHVEQFVSRHQAEYDRDEAALFDVAVHQEHLYRAVLNLWLERLFDRRPLVPGDLRVCHVLGKVNVVDTRVADSFRSTGRYAVTYTLCGVAVSDEASVHLDTMRSTDPMTQFASLFWLVSHFGVCDLHAVGFAITYVSDPCLSLMLCDLGLK